MANLSEKLRVNFTPEEREQIERAAFHEHRSVASLIRIATIAHLAKLEYQKGDKS